MTTRNPLVLVGGSVQELPGGDTLPGASVGAAITAAGTTAADATPITASINNVTTTTTGQGVRLPAATTGARIVISNTTGSRMLSVYPAPGEAIDLYGVDGDLSLLAYSLIEVVCATTGLWQSTIRAAQNTTYFTSTMPVNKGGTGATTLTGLVKGNGTSAMTAAVAGTDYIDPAGLAAVATGVNTGDETTATIKTKLGITTLSGSNTGDQDLSGKQDTLVSGTNIRTVNGNTLLGSTNLVIAGGVTSVNGETGAVTVTAGLSLAQAHAIALSF